MNLSSIVQQLQAEQQHQAAARPATAIASTRAVSSAGSTSASSSDSTNDATITADDFLQLLVSELQNQDPTADTDPNEYVDQLVNVNSLQQLISINQEVGDLSPSSTTDGISSIVAGNAAAAQEPNASPAAAAAQVADARASYAALYPRAESSAQATANRFLTPANASGAPDGPSSIPANSAIPASWRSETVAAH